MELNQDEGALRHQTDVATAISLTFQAEIDRCNDIFSLPLLDQIMIALEMEIKRSKFEYGQLNINAIAPGVSVGIKFLPSQKEFEEALVSISENTLLDFISFNKDLLSHIIFPNFLRYIEVLLDAHIVSENLRDLLQNEIQHVILKNSPHCAAFALILEGEKPYSQYLFDQFVSNVLHMLKSRVMTTNYNYIGTQIPALSTIALLAPFDQLSRIHFMTCCVQNICEAINAIKKEQYE